MSGIDAIHRFSPFLRGFGRQFAPDIIKGFIINYLKAIPVKVIIKYVEANASLWEQLPIKNQQQFRTLASNLSDLDFFTSDWLIDITRKEVPATASLFMSWKKSRNWLDRQVKIIKEELGFG